MLMLDYCVETLLGNAGPERSPDIEAQRRAQIGQASLRRPRSDARETFGIGVGGLPGDRGKRRGEEDGVFAATGPDLQDLPLLRKHLSDRLAIAQRRRRVSFCPVVEHGQTLCDFTAIRLIVPERTGDKATREGLKGRKQ